MGTSAARVARQSAAARRLAGGQIEIGPRFRRPANPTPALMPGRRANGNFPMTSRSRTSAKHLAIPEQAGAQTLETRAIGRRKAIARTADAPRRDLAPIQ